MKGWIGDLVSVALLQIFEESSTYVIVRKVTIPSLHLLRNDEIETTLKKLGILRLWAKKKGRYSLMFPTGGDAIVRTFSVIMGHMERRVARVTTGKLKRQRWVQTRF